MDFTTISYEIWTALISLLSGFILGSKLLLLSKKRVDTFINKKITDFLESLPQLIEDNPELMQSIAKPLIAQLMKAFGAPSEGGEPKDLKIGGFKVPAWLVQTLMSQFMQKGKETAKEGITNLFPQ